MHAVTLGSAEIVVEEQTRPDRQAHAVSQNDREHLLGDVAALQSLDAGIIFRGCLGSTSSTVTTGHQRPFSHSTKQSAERRPPQIAAAG